MGSDCGILNQDCCNIPADDINGGTCNEPDLICDLGRCEPCGTVGNRICIGKLPLLPPICWQSAGAFTRRLYFVTSSYNTCKHTRPDTV